MTRPLKKPLYDNILLLAPDEEPLCCCNFDKANWYIKRGLADIISVNPTKVRLTFEPKGRGHAGDLFYLNKRENKCVVCGTTESLTRHHVIPYCFRKHFPDKAKCHNSHDICCLCIYDHERYESFADELKMQLAKRYDVSLFGSGAILDQHLLRVKRHATVLLEYRNRIPNDRISVLEQTLRDYFDKDEFAAEDIVKASKINPVVKNNDFHGFGAAIVEKIENLQEFVVMWRKHFILKMQPQFMPAHWSIDRDILGV